MRLWSIHPACLDSKGLVAVWREGLLALAVLSGATRGYVRHPQLTRFRNHPDPVAAITGYLATVADEAGRRGFRFDRSKLIMLVETVPIPVTAGQLDFEFDHLKRKLAKRHPAWRQQFETVEVPPVHPSFVVVEGGIEPWEKVGNAAVGIQTPGTSGNASAQAGFKGSA